MSSGPDEIRVRAIISGRVQGVAFRYATRSEAERLGVRGWVRNLPSGAVEAVFEGPRAIVETIVAWCHRGPPAASVQDVSLHDETLGSQPLRGFEIRY